LVSGSSPVRLGNAHPNIVPYQALATGDGHIILAVGNDAQFSRFCTVAGCPELADDGRFRTNADRVRNREELIPFIMDALKLRSSAEWIAAFEEAGVPCGPINTIAEVFANPQVQSRGMRVDVPHTVAGKIPLVGSPMKFSRSPLNDRLPPPQLGEHNDEVLAGMLGLASDELERLRAAGII
jgi:crotonobetainyl-CoA:carnitine CoA-transferase CaiB-like acyl-CoA transferase